MRQYQTCIFQGIWNETPDIIIHSMLERNDELILTRFFVKPEPANSPLRRTDLYVHYVVVESFLYGHSPPSTNNATPLCARPTGYESWKLEYQSVQGSPGNIAFSSSESGFLI